MSKVVKGIRIKVPKFKSESDKIKLLSYKFHTTGKHYKVQIKCEVMNKWKIQYGTWYGTIV